MSDPRSPVDTTPPVSSFSAWPQDVSTPARTNRGRRPPAIATSSHLRAPSSSAPKMVREASGARPVSQLAVRRQPHLQSVDQQLEQALAQKAEALEEQRRHQRVRQWLGTGVTKLTHPVFFFVASSLSAGGIAPWAAAAVGWHPVPAAFGCLAVLLSCTVLLRQYFETVWHALYAEQKTHPTRAIHAAIGACCGLHASPLYALPASTALSPLMGVTFVGLLGLSTLSFWGPNLGCLPSIMDVGVATAACLASASPWLTVWGLSAAEAAALGLVLSGGIIGLSALAAMLTQLMARSAPTPMADALCRDRREVLGCRFAREAAGSGIATLVDTPAELLDLAGLLRANTQQARRDGRGQPGMVVSTLYGPPGTGKTVSAFGLAQALDGDVIVTSASELDDSALAPIPVAFVRLTRLLLEANDRGRRGDARPQVVFIDEFDDLFAKLDPRLHTASEYHVLGYKMFASVLGLIAQGDCRVTVMLATNNLTQEVRELLKMITKRPPIYVGPMTAPGAARLTGLQLDRLQRHFQQKFEVELDSFAESEEGAKLAATLFDKGASGRHLRYPLAMAQNQTTHAFWEHRSKNTQKKDFDLRAEVLCRLLTFAQHVDPRSSQRRMSSASLAKSERHVDIDDFMERIGLQRMHSTEIIFNIVEQFWQGYMTDPETSLAINMFGAELLVILLRVSALYLEQVSAPQPARGLNDVPLSALQQQTSHSMHSRMLAPVIDAIKTSCSLGFRGSAGSTTA